MPRLDAACKKPLPTTPYTLPLRAPSAEAPEPGWRLNKAEHTFAHYPVPLAHILFRLQLYAHKVLSPCLASNDWLLALRPVRPRPCDKGRPPNLIYPHRGEHPCIAVRQRGCGAGTLHRSTVGPFWSGRRSRRVVGRTSPTKVEKRVHSSPKCTGHMSMCQRCLYC